jgi:hypothetical protein
LLTKEAHFFSNANSKNHYYEVMSDSNTTFKRKYSAWKKGKAKRAKPYSKAVAKIARQVVNSSGQPAYVTTYLSYSDPNQQDVAYFNVARKYEPISEIAHVSRGMFLDLSNCPKNTSTPGTYSE